MDKRDKLVAIDILAIVVGRCIEKQMDDAALYFGNMFISLVSRYLQEYPEDIEIILERAQGPKDNGTVN